MSQLDCHCLSPKGPHFRGVCKIGGQRVAWGDLCEALGYNLMKYSLVFYQNFGWTSCESKAVIHSVWKPEAS
jgi:hypothetical protein